MRILPFLLFFPAIHNIQAQYGGNVEEGVAVFYADGLHGQATAYGEEYRQEGFTAAHQFYPPGTIVRVTRLDNGKSVDVRINDKMAPDDSRKIILSRAAALQLDLIRFGRALVRIERLSDGSFNSFYTAADGGYRASAPAAASGPLTPRPPYSEGNGYSSGARPSAYGYNSSAGAGGANYSSRSPYGAQAPYYSTSSTQALPAQTYGYAVQLASYREVGNAVSNVLQLRQRGLQEACVWQKDGMNRVVIAGFPDKESATRYLNGLRQQYLMDGIVVKIQ